jgi:hypothetical protein
MTYPVIIGIAGKAQSGKDTVAKYIRTKALNTVGLNYITKPFASKVKLVTSQLYGFPVDWAYSAEGKQRLVMGTTVRHWLQKVGETMRDYIGKDVWIDGVLTPAERLYTESGAGVIIPDVRYQNELKRIKSAFSASIPVPSAVIKVVRIGENKLSEKEASHSSEIDLDSVPDTEYDAVFEAVSGDVNGLLGQVESWWKGLGK